MTRWTPMIVAVLAACAPAEPDTADAADDQMAVHEDGWTTQLANGVAVRLRPESLPIRAGSTTFRIELDREPVADPEVSIDVLSPSMPAHGVTRYEARRDRPGQFVVEAEIPMAGAWNVYVNLDEGETAAPFAFEVLAAETASVHGAHGHHGSSAADSAGTPHDTAPRQ